MRDPISKEEISNQVHLVEIPCILHIVYIFVYVYILLCCPQIYLHICIIRNKMLESIKN